NLTTSNVSLLQARVTVYNANHQVLGTMAATDPLHGDLSLTVPGSLLGGTYYIEVEGANNDVFSVGSYQMTIGVGTVLGISLPTTTYTSPISLANPGTIVGAALSLLPTWTNPSDLRFNVSTYGQINSAGQQNWVYVPPPPAGSY